MFMCRLFIVFREKKYDKFIPINLVRVNDGSFLREMYDEKNVDSREICLRRNYRDSDT